MFAQNDKQKIKQVYISKYNAEHPNRVTFVMIVDGEKWCYLAVKNLSKLLRGISQKIVVTIIVLNTFNQLELQINSNHMTMFPRIIITVT